jgi:acyl-CoA thioesterase-1
LETCRFPEQLKDSLLQNFEEGTTFSLQVIARTGWTTTNLIDAIASENIPPDFDLVTLLIGVNNQYQRKDFSLYETEFPALVSTAIKAINNDKNNLIVISIPDYAFTPFGGGNTNISEEIDLYNEFAKDYCNRNEITFLNITDITREGFINPNLVASDNLHPSALAYTKFVERLLPLSLEKLK